MVMNVVTAVVSLACQLLINFWLSPYLVSHIGIEANGFVSLANNFVTYASLIVTALNSMASRFITIAYAQKDIKKANLYYNSVFWGNLIIVAVLLLPASILCFWPDKFITVPANLLNDVRILFAMVFIAFFLKTGFPNWDCGTYVANRLDRDNIPNIIIQIVRCAFLVLAYTLLKPHVYYIGIAGVLVCIMQLIVAHWNMRTFVPEMRVSFGKNGILCSKSALAELVGAGIWNSISSIGNILIDGVDLLVCNLLLGATPMGIVAVSKTLPSCITQFANSIRWAFLPQLTLNYAAGDKEKTQKDMHISMRVLCFIVTIPLAIIIAVGTDFYKLWMPSQDPQLLYILSVLASITFAFTGSSYLLTNVFTVTNTVKANSIARIITGVISICVTVAIAKFTNYGIYAVACVSSVMGILREIIFTLPYAAKALGFDKQFFFKEMLANIICAAILCAVCCLIRRFMPAGTWLQLVLTCAVMGVVCVVLNYFILFRKNERSTVLSMVRAKLKI